jgi:hypothetical protein
MGTTRDAVKDQLKRAEGEENVRRYEAAVARRDARTGPS